MAKKSSSTKVTRLFSLMKSGKEVSRSTIADHFGHSEARAQVFMRYIAERGIPVKPSKVEGRAHLYFICTDVSKFKDIVENGGRMRDPAKTGQAPVKSKPAKSDKPLSAKQAGKASKHVPKAVKQKIAQTHLDDAPGVFDDRPASERKGKVSILDKDMAIANLNEREFNDIKSMLGIDL